MIDLHCHSHYSDGLLSPSELILRAQQCQLRFLSLTDHDTVDGYDELLNAASSTSIHVIPGIELSVRWKKSDIHILGYQINFTDYLKKLISTQVENRVNRAHAIGHALKTIGVADAYDKACYFAGHTRVARPHFAKILVAEGHAKDVQTAFKKFLTRGKIAYVPTPWINVQEAVEGIVRAGGQAVIAHPLKYRLTRSKLHELINEFKEAGGVGIEVVSGRMTSSEINEVAGVSNRFNLLASSGSDFHGDTPSHIPLGGQKKLPEHCTPIWTEWL